jgi:shikimate dehydrogenase
VNKITRIRKNIDNIDKKIIRLLQERFKCSLEAKKVKIISSSSVLQEDRQNQVLQNNHSQIFNKEDYSFYDKIYDEIFNQSRRFQYKRLAVLGDSVEDSFSPVVYDYIARKNKIDLVYDKIVISNGADFYSTIKKLKSGKYDGFNVSSPLKKYAYLINDISDDFSRVTEAANTLFYKNGLFYTYNTDYSGFRDFLQRKSINTIDKKILILGNGSTANTIYTLLLKDTTDICVCIRRESQHKKIFTKVVYYDEIDSLLEYDLVINATSSPNPIDLISFPPRLYIDVNYKNIPLFSEKTTYFSGIELLIFQAINSFKFFFENLNIEMSDQDIDNILKLYEDGIK